MSKAQPLVVFYPDTRGVVVSRFGRGNAKIGMGVYTYSRLAGRDFGTCPGSTEECENICYAKRINGVVKETYLRNSWNADVPEIPQDAKLLRVHVSGDFDSVEYITHWIARIEARPDVKVWAYTRSWRVPHLLPTLELLRALPNVQMFASMDPSCKDMPPAGWRRAWIERSFDKALDGPWMAEDRMMYVPGQTDEHHMWNIADGTPSYICPEETGRKPNCEACRYCFDGHKNDVTFLEH